MKKLITLIVCVMAVGSVMAQAPDMFNYQAVARDGSGNILANESINVTFLIHSGTAGGAVVFEEDHTGISTNDFGLFNLQIGDGTNVSGSIDGINWGSDNYFLEIEVNGASAGTQQLVSVPYAQYAKESGNKSPWTTSGSDISYSSGNVGIGTTSPSEALHIVGTATMDNFTFNNTNASMIGFVNGGEIGFKVTGDLRQTANYDIGDETEPWDRGHFKQVELQTTTSFPQKNYAYGNSLPLAYGYFSDFITSVSVTTDYGISSVTRTSTGVYEVTLDNAFDGSPVVSVTTFNNSPGDEIATYSVSGDNKIIVNVSDGSGSGVSSNFSLLVYGIAK